MTQDHVRKAVLLAAGVGSRLGSLTDSTPKCLLEIDGTPLIEHTLRHLARQGIEDVLLNLHHLPSSIPDLLKDGRQLGIKLSYTFETELLGTAGTVLANRQWLDATTLIWYADNLSNCDLDRMTSVHRSTGDPITIAVRWREDVRHSGVVRFDDDGHVTAFVEKPDQREGAFINAGIYLLESDAVGCIFRTPPCDFGQHVFPQLLASHVGLGTYQLDDTENLWWVDRPEDLMRTRSEFLPARAGSVS